MSVNILYSALVSGANDIPDMWGKTRGQVVLTDKATRLIQAMVGGIPDAIRAQYACIVCHAVRNTLFGPDILALDPSNTYSDPAKALQADGDAYPTFTYSISEYMPTYNGLWSAVKPLLDPDVRDRTYSGDLFDVLGAACLQLLMEIA